jgi:hypothetical protein
MRADTCCCELSLSKKHRELTTRQPKERSVPTATCIPGTRPTTLMIHQKRPLKGFGD